MVNGAPKLVEKFKDEAGRVKRQGAQFKLFAYDSNDPSASGREVTLDDAGVEGIEWTVHLANKKACWYEGSELDGDLMLGEQNSTRTGMFHYAMRMSRARRRDKSQSSIRDRAR